MTLALHTLAPGPDPLVLVHGWGFDHRIFAPLLPHLPAGRGVLAVDLPGHGAAAPPPPGLAPRSSARALAHALPSGSVWVGWSLGGLLALAAALEGHAAPRGLVLLCASPRFLAGPDWPWGVPPAQLDALAATLEADPVAARDRFLALQLRDPGLDGGLRRHVRQAMREPPAPTAGGLALGLRALAELDLRQGVAGLDCPVTLLLGDRDPLTPAGSAEAIRALAPSWQVRVLRGAGHLPFLTQAPHIGDALARLDWPAHVR